MLKICHWSGPSGFPWRLWGYPPDRRVGQMPGGLRRRYACRCKREPVVSHSFIVRQRLVILGNALWTGVRPQSRFLPLDNRMNVCRYTGLDRSAPPGLRGSFLALPPDCVRCRELHPGLFSSRPSGTKCRAGALRPDDALERFRFMRRPLKIVRGGIFFHPSDQESAAGNPG
jgi:hypothetical protein